MTSFVSRILFLRGLGWQNPDPVLTNLYLDQLEKTLEKILHPHKVEVVKLISPSNYAEYHPYLRSLNLSSYDLIIGHSSGANALMRLSETERIEDALLIAPTFTHLLDPTEKRTGWFNTPWMWSDMKANVGNWYQISSTNDPYINLRESRIIHKRLNTVYFELDRQGHFSNWFKLGSHESTRLKLLVDQITGKDMPFKAQLREH